MSDEPTNIEPIEGQSHRCRWYNVDGTQCRNVVGNSSNHCAADHPNKIVQALSNDDVREAASVTALAPSYDVDDVVDSPGATRDGPQMRNSK